MICWMRPRRRGVLIRALMGGTTAAAAFALLADVRPALTQTPLDLYRERTAMLAVGDRCRLFDAGLSSALQSGQDQARTAALRGGLTSDAVDQGAADARAAVAALPCGSARVQQAAQRTRDGYRAWAGLQRMAFPGDVGAWRADRAMPIKTASWRLAQSAFAGQDKVVFGLAGQNGAEAMTVSVAPSDGQDPYAARLIVRDPQILPQPFLKAASTPLSARLPPRAGARVIQAEARAEADPGLRPLGASAAVAFRFPASVQKTIETLDPREALSVELLYPSDRGELVRTAFVEVGDFNAGVAFLKDARR